MSLLGGIVSRKTPKQPGTTKADLVDAVYRRHGAMTKAEATTAVEAIFSTVKNSLQDGRSVRIRNFGVFEVSARGGRTGVNPASGERMFIPPRTGLTFKPSRFLKTVLTDEEDS
ncbi:MAG: HU family DNA-binding protein [Acidobacteriota bacterium]